MQRETPLIPVTEPGSSARTPMHLRYLSLLRSNRSFRRLWMAQLISEIGDWFYSLAVYDLLLQTTHHGKSVSWAIILQTLPWFLMTPLAGHIADRFSRRRLMIVADLARGLVVLGLLLVREPSQVWLVYLLLGLEVVFASIFEPSRNALMPDLVSAGEILSANALSSATWSVALFSGAAIGGLVTAMLGRSVAFAVNSGSFFVSALLIRSIIVRESHLTAEGQHSTAAAGGGNTQTLRACYAYLRGKTEVLVLVSAKTGLGILSGALLLLAVFGERVFPLAGHGSLAMGLLYSARGVGAGIGPLIGDRLVRDRESRMWKIISAGFFLMSLAYTAFSHAPNIELAALSVMFAHMGGSIVWVMSTTLLHLNVAESYRGRVFALDFGLLMLMVSGTNYTLGAALDNWGFSPRQLAAALGLALFVPGLLWLLAQRRWARRVSRRNGEGGPGAHGIPVEGAVGHCHSVPGEEEGPVPKP